jgi:hypothetical protein
MDLGKHADGLNRMRMKVRACTWSHVLCVCDTCTDARVAGHHTMFVLDIRP